MLLPVSKWQRYGASALIGIALLIAIGVGLLTTAAPAAAKLRIDFDQAYLVHPGVQTWDFCVIRPDSLYHVYYTAVRESGNNASEADTLFHATSPDLRHWDLVGPALIVGPEWWDEGALWAPDVIWDEAEQRWIMFYTGVDIQMNQRICLAFSDDLYTWTKWTGNPAIEPDPAQYIWDPESWWSDFRDPFVYHQDDKWHILVTAKKWVTQGTGVLYHAISDDLLNWQDVGPLFYNDGSTPWRVPESPQYHQRGDVYHLLFGEYDTIGSSHLPSPEPNSFSMADRSIIDYGYAPEIDQFDPGIDIFSRLANFSAPTSEYITYTIRFDTLHTSPDGQDLIVYKPNPLEEHFEYIQGTSNMGNPTFGNNPSFRGDPGVGLVGNGYYGSGEYFRGPLSGIGQPGTKLGGTAVGELRSYPFVITGTQIDMLVGGGNYPETCYIALMDAATDTVLFKESGEGAIFMTPRTWLLNGLYGRLVYLAIVDQETSLYQGWINIDEIIESGDVATAPGVIPSRILVDLGPAPNPFNPATWIRFEARQACQAEVRVIDLRGRSIWSSGSFACEAGTQAVSWRGQDQQGRDVPAGTYIYTIETEHGVATSGKLCLVK